MVYQELHGALVVLRPLQQCYFSEYLEAFSPRVRAWLHLRDSAAEIAYLQTALAKCQNNQTYFYCIFDRHVSYLIGALEIRDASQGCGQLYSWIHERYWGKGHFREALLLLSRAYFAWTQALFFSARVDIVNRRSYHALTKCGFAQLGVVAGPRGKQYELILRRK